MAKIKNKYIPFLTFFIIFLFCSANFVLALEVKFGGLGENPTLPQYASFIFTWAISIAGIISLVSFAIGAVGLIVSGGNPELSSNSRDRMKGAIVGLVLTLASFMIVYTINPNLTTFKFNTLPPVPVPPVVTQAGVYFYMNPDCSGDSAFRYTSDQKNIPARPDNVSICIKIVDDSANGIYYGIIIHKTPNGGLCLPPITNKSKNLDDGKIILEPEIKSFAADIFRINTQSGSTGDGVTFYSEAHGAVSAHKAGFKIIPDNEINRDVSVPIEDTFFDPNKMCFSSLNVEQPPQYFYKCDDPYLTSCEPLRVPCECSPEQAAKYGYTSSTLCCDCTPTGCNTFKDCFRGSVEVTGDYLVGLYSQTPEGVTYCYTFDNSDAAANLNAEPILAPGAKSIEKVYIIPIKK